MAKPGENSSARNFFVAKRLQRFTKVSFQLDGASFFCRGCPQCLEGNLQSSLVMINLNLSFRPDEVEPQSFPLSDLL